MRLLLSFSLLLLLSMRLSSQFYTLRPKQVESFKIVVDSAKLLESEAKKAAKEEKESIKEETENFSPVNRFYRPIKDTLLVTSNYGYRKDPINGREKYHYGVDLRAKASPVYSILPGEIRKVGYEKKGLGNYIVVNHGNVDVTYGHLSVVLQRKGAKVDAGTPLGISGSTGRSTGEHLHLAVKVSGRHVNPLPLLMFIEQQDTL